MNRLGSSPSPDTPDNGGDAHGCRVLLGRFLLFAAVGAVGTLAHYAVMIALVEVLRVPPVPASVGGFLVGMAVNYMLNYRYTFRSDKRHREAAAKFFVVGCCGLGLNAALMYLGAGTLGIHYLVAQLAATAVVLLWNFGANQLWTFAREGHGR
ncbi:MAG: GtrA family protein [Planctomycetota bacterium]